MAIKTFLDLEVYQLAHKFAMVIFELTKSFPYEERFSLTDQIRRSPRSIAVNTAEGWGKRVYVGNFKRHLVDGIRSLEESKSWLLFAKDCNYITIDIYKKLLSEAEVLGSKLQRLHDNWQDFNS
ncbi:MULTISPECIES: four helix bundle protein [Niastella]|uniref:Four helix bundle protein n=1 Tax=Niastella soli TaxID=2821487 RepID=A0ABS3Z0G5_9BACT|nr:four helix bundle protein [Niastella soli]MBO9203643.1 four helix bundle protein [Niastella soli]